MPTFPQQLLFFKNSLFFLYVYFLGEIEKCSIKLKKIHVTYLWNLKDNMNKQTKQTQTQMQRTNWGLPAGREWGTG